MRKRLQNLLHFWGAQKACLGKTLPAPRIWGSWDGGGVIFFCVCPPYGSPSSQLMIKIPPTNAGELRNCRLLLLSEYFCKSRIGFCVRQCLGLLFGLNLSSSSRSFYLATAGCSGCRPTGMLVKTYYLHIVHT